MPRSSTPSASTRSSRSGWRALAHSRRTLPGVSSPRQRRQVHQRDRAQQPRGLPLLLHRAARRNRRGAALDGAAVHADRPDRVEVERLPRISRHAVGRGRDVRHQTGNLRARENSQFGVRPQYRVRSVSDPDCLWPLASGLRFGFRLRSAGAAPGLAGVGRSTFPQADMLEELKRKLGDEVEKLTHELNVVLPNEIRKAVELGGSPRKQRIQSRVGAQQFVQARLSQLRQRLSKLSSIDMAQIPLDKVGLGSRVVVVEQDTKVQETYHLVFGDSENFDEGHVTMSSPIGKALVGKGVGDDVLFKLPARTRRLRILS